MLRDPLSARASTIVVGVALALATTTVVAAAPPVIENPAAPPQHRAVTLQETWRAGGEDDESVLLGQIGNAGVDDAGRVYALDTQLAQVLVFGPEGALAATLGREGDGPGEMRRPIGLDVQDDGLIAVVQPFPGKIVYLDRDGTPAGEFSLGGDDPTQGGLGILYDSRERAGHLVVGAQRSSFDLDAGEIREERFLAAASRDEGVLRRYAETSTSRNLQKMVFDELQDFHPGERGRWDVGPDGRLWVNTRFDAYEITVYAPDGTVERVVTRPHDRRQRTEQEIADLKQGVNIDVNGRRPEIEYVIQDRAPSLERLFVLADGSVWVENSHARDRWDEEGIVTYDVLDSGGRLREEVTVTVPGGGEEHRLILLDDGRFLLARGMADLSVTVEAGGGDELTQTEAPDATVVPELVCFARP